MPRFLTQFAYTREAWQALVKNPMDREAAFRRLVEQMGGTFISLDYCFGDYDGVAIFEAPDSRTALATAIAAVAENAGKTTANRVRGSLSTLCAWSIREGLIETNPVLNTNIAIERPRDRTLSPEELRLIWTHAGNDDYGTILRLLALTGARANEIAALRWSEIRDDMIVLPPSRTKSSRGHEIFLSVAAQQILRAHPRRTNPDGSSRDLIFGSAGPFTGWSHAKTKIDARIAAATGKPLPAWVPHDLRRRLFHARKRARLGAAARHRSVSRSYQWFPSGGCRHIQSSALSVRNAHSMATLG